MESKHYTVVVHDDKVVASKMERKIRSEYSKLFNKVVTILVACLITAIALTVVVTKTATEQLMLVQTSEEVVFVQENDTLWNLSKGSCPEGMDLRKYIDIVVKYNDKDSAGLDVGEVIKLPIFKLAKY